MTSQAGISRIRFLTEVDDYFLCKVCEGVAVLPTECSACESVMCSLCAKEVTSCPICRRELALRDIARFGKKVYAAFLLTCRNQGSGCTEQGCVADILQHERICQYSLVVCQNSLCSSTFHIKDAYRDQMCSSTCYEVKLFESHLASLTQEEILQRLQGLLSAMRTDVLAELQAKLEPELAAVNQQLAEVESFWQTQRPEMERELEARRHHWHSGKWSTSAKWWSCCHSEDTCSVGCKGSLS